MTRVADRLPAKKRRGTDTAAAPGYLESRRRILLILAAFPLLALPLAWLQIRQPPGWFAASAVYLVLLGGTHFIITLGVYLHGRNLRYFASSPGRILVYFVVPPAILVAFFLIGFFGLNAQYPGMSPGFVLYVFLFTIAVRALDFLHVVRQSFGMLQLFKGQSRGGFPRWMRTADNSFFLSLAGLQLWTFVNGLQTGQFEFTPGTVSTMLLAMMGISLAGVAGGFAVAARSTHGAALAVPAMYFLFQGASGALAAWRSELYTATLAMHYVEYHVMMYPRLFAFAPDPSSRADRAASWIRGHKTIFYGALAVLAFFAARDTLWGPVSRELGTGMQIWLLFNLLNGIFVMHYFIEAFIWKFRNPYYRESLAPLYLPKPA